MFEVSGLERYHFVYVYFFTFYVPILFLSYPFVDTEADYCNSMSDTAVQYFFTWCLIGVSFKECQVIEFVLLSR